jgi:hypothetical protein
MDNGRHYLRLIFTWAVGLLWGIAIGNGNTAQLFGEVGSVLASFIVGVLMAIVWSMSNKWANHESWKQGRHF